MTIAGERGPILPRGGMSDKRPIAFQYVERTVWISINLMGCPGFFSTKMETVRFAIGKRLLGRRREACVCSLEKVGVRAREDFVVQGIKVYWFHVMIGVPVLFVERRWIRCVVNR